MKISQLFFLVLLCSINLFSQSYSISGQIADSTTKKLLGKANIILTHLPDSKIKGIIADNDGKFRIDYVVKGKYLLTVSYLGYKSYKRNIDIDHSIELPKINLIPDRMMMHEVKIIGQTSGVTINNDTTEYSADAFKVNKDAVAEDLLEKMPGITVQDDKVQAHGEDVTNVLVDGKMYFGSDPNAALKNIPAEIIEKIQVFDQQSDQSKFTGFDDGNTTKTINIVTRLKVRQGTFGKIYAGYGDEDKYSAGGNINFFNNDQRISILTQFNNVNVQNFSSEDLLGVMSSSGQGGRRGMGGSTGGRRGSSGPPSGGNPGFGSSQGGQGGPGSSSASNFLVSQIAGINTTKAFGLNYQDKWGENFDINGSYFFNLTNNNANSLSNRNYFLTSSTAQSYDQNTGSSTKNINHRLNFRMNYQIDTSNSLMFHPIFSAQINNGTSANLANTFSGLNALSTTTSTFNTNLTGLNSSNELLFRHKFDTPQRTISIDFNGSYSKNSGDNNLYAEDLYYNNAISSDTLNQVSDLLKQGLGASTSVVYTEPFTEFGMLQFNAKYNYTEDKSDKTTFDQLVSSSNVDTGLSNVYKKYYTTQSYGAGYRFREESLSFALGANYDIAELRNRQTFPYSNEMERKFYSILPTAMLQYKVSNDVNLRFFYRTNNDDPSVDQLHSVLNN
jgi:hypothetical protein